MPDAFADLDAAELRGLLSDFAKNWLAHDGLWFQAVENAHGMEAAMEADAVAWGRFAGIEARRIKKRFGLGENGGLDALAAALGRRMYAALNECASERIDERTLRFRMIECRVQDARNRKGMEPFPCKPVGIVEFTSFAREIDERIQVSCVTCPPDEHHEGTWCAWEFTMPE
jgi:Family of unknown function (DUF6125)